MVIVSTVFFFFFNDTATTEIYTLSLHDALPIYTNAIKQVHSSISTICGKLKDKGFEVREKGNILNLNVSDLDFKEIYKLKEKIKDTQISGIKGIDQILVVKRENDFVILTSGTNLKEILDFKGVRKEKIMSNDIHEIKEIFGIETARNVIVKEIKKIIESQGLDIDERHLKLVGDAMTFSGEIKGITRMGIISQKSSILARASFETPIKQFVNATINANKDELASVIENIILNQPVPVGTGLPGLLVKVTGKLDQPKKKEVKKAGKIVKKIEEKKKDK